MWSTLVDDEVRNEELTGVGEIGEGEVDVHVAVVDERKMLCSECSTMAGDDVHDGEVVDDRAIVQCGDVDVLEMSLGSCKTARGRTDGGASTGET